MLSADLANLLYRLYNLCDRLTVEIVTLHSAKRCGQQVCADRCVGKYIDVSFWFQFVVLFTL